MDKQRKNIYRNLFVVYTAVIALLMGLLNLYFLKYSMDSAKDKKMYINQQLVGDVTAKIDNQFIATRMITDSIYTYRDNILDLLKFMNLDFIEYKRQKLDALSESKGISYYGTEVLVQRTFASYDNVQNISIVSRSRNTISTFNKNSQIDFRKIDNFDELTNKSVILRKNTITHIVKINDPSNLNTEGLMLITFKLDELNSLFKTYSNFNKVYVIGNNDTMIYNSTDNLNSSWVSKVAKNLEQQEVFFKVGSDYYNVNYLEDGITVIGQVSRSNFMLPVTYYVALVFINLIVFGICEGIIYIKVKKLNARMNNTINAMERVKQGDLKTRIEESNFNDELAYIDKRFNEMCEDLDLYIKKSYIAEINQKNAEMKHLQSQINPHFLYNTLEVIRMKAICSGNKDVGKMLYNLAVLFRSQLKEKDIITIEKELDYCRKYLDLFKFRYEDKFSYEIECDNNLLGNNIIKFILQPLIENYVVHGVRLSDDDNEMKIIIKECGSIIEVHIIDNGKGISDEKLEEIKIKLSDKNANSDSIGIINVNQRLKNTYGEQYGVTFIEGVEIGTQILVKIPKN
ncbi:MAG: sensor histidine kinase [Sarcina sp.]